MQYCVIVKIGRSQVSFFYQQKGGKVMPLEYRGTHIHPLYFYLHHNDFSFGSYARQLFLNGNPDSFGNYFDIITQPSKTFNFYGNEKHVKYLLNLAVELALNHFFSTVLYEPSAIESYRADFPLRLIFEPDVQEKEKRLTEQLFSEAGFQNLDVLSIYRFLFEELTENNITRNGDRLVTLQSVNGCLFILYFDQEYTTPAYLSSFANLGTDPRIKVTAELIYNAATAITRTVLRKKDEIPNLVQYAVRFLENGSAQPRGEVALSDGSKAFVTIRMRDVYEQIAYLGFDTKVFNAIDGFLKEYNINPGGNLKFLLLGPEINSYYFIDKLSNRYVNVIQTKPIVMYNALERAAKFIEDNDYALAEALRPALPSIPVAMPPVSSQEHTEENITRPVLPQLPVTKKDASATRIPVPRLPQVKEDIAQPAKPEVPGKKQQDGNTALPPLPPVKKTK